MYNINDDYVKEYKEKFGEDKTKWCVLLPVDTEDFYDFIEPGILELVKVCIELGFRPVSSCEGHPHGRFIRIGFNDSEEELKNHFISLLKEAQLEGIKFKVETSNRVSLHDQSFIDQSVNVAFSPMGLEKHYKNLVEFLQSKK